MMNHHDSWHTNTFIIKVWYFGLKYIDVQQQPAWLDFTKKIKQQSIKPEQLLKLDFRFKYYPENVADEVIQDITLKLLFLQVMG